ncbi:MAG: prepilin-type N-terminal cleavage/methylation domain-containing protein [Nitrospirae bacterium]|nr:prepilin-type N-terminal cleavage/methylation domain-containing protein [Nitrospirota bacterium]
MGKDLRQKGFTLIELAIVLVIIGIIMGAVIKGQDLMTSAKAKKFTTTVNTWNMLTWAYMDRMGRFPGDASSNGIIGDVAASEQTAAASAIGELAAAGTMDNAPTNPVIIGGQSLWIYYGNDVPPSGARNVMVICSVANCATAFTADALRIVQSVDTSIDGTADAGLGQFRGATAVTLAGAGTINTRTVAAVTAVTGVNETAAGAATAWATTQNAAVWLFDRPY